MLTTETPLTFTEACKKLPKIGGKRPHPSTLWRWARRGCRGVHLETRRFGGRFVTSVEALDRFGEALAAIPLPEHDAPPPQPRPRTRTEKQRDRAVARAEVVLRSAGIIEN